MSPGQRGWLGDRGRGPTPIQRALPPPRGAPSQAVGWGAEALLAPCPEPRSEGILGQEAEVSGGPWGHPGRVQALMSLRASVALGGAPPLLRVPAGLSQHIGVGRSPPPQA